MPFGARPVGAQERGGVLPLDSRTLKGNELLHVSLEPGGAVRLEATVETAERVLIDGPGRSPTGGEFSSLFAAWCRSAGIPARIVYGTWARGRMSAHAWNEFWLEGVGWVPVDASIGWAMRHRPWNWLGEGLPLRPDAYFARLDGARIGFSYGPDVEASPAFPPVAVDGGTELRVAGRELRWGVETLDGRLPYLQPAYPRFTSTPGRRQDLLGRWRVSELGAVGAFVRVRNVAFVVLAVAVAASLVVEPALFVVLAAAAASAGAVIGERVLRRRRTAAG